MTIYHLDTGDLLPEVRDIVDEVEDMAPNFVRVQTDVAGWIRENGLPTDLMPHSSHPIGAAMGEHGTRLVPRYDCCFHNLMGPIYARIHADGNTLLIRGTKAADMKTLPLGNGGITDGMELFYPLQNWSHAEVFSYLRTVGAPICRVYEMMDNAPECARCSAWWGEERNRYLREYHPDLWLHYRSRLELVADEIAGPLAKLRHELGEDT